MDQQSTRSKGQDEEAKKPFVFEVIKDKVCIAQNVKPFASAKKFRCFQTQNLRYHPLCDDFGPMNLLSVTQFIELLDAELEADSNSKLVYCVEPGRRALTNAVFLLGAYLIIKLNRTTAEVLDAFPWLEDSLVEPFRDATFSKRDFDLTLPDCWRALERSCNIGWLQLPSPSSPGCWGKIDINEYDHYDNPLNGDLHCVVPDKFVAFRGPKELGPGATYRDDADGNRFFSPAYYVDVFRELGVSAVVRLNEPEYDRDAFVAGGLAHADLEFEDCTTPPAHVVSAFLAAADAAPGAVAVHCKAGLGRTGTLIALYMMRSLGFTAREAIGWLRIMRPGSVIGQQQHYLCAVERAAAQRAERAAAAAAAAVQAAALAGAAVRRDDLRPQCPPRAAAAAAHEAAPAPGSPKAAAAPAPLLPPLTKRLPRPQSPPATPAAAAAAAAAAARGVPPARPAAGPGGDGAAAVLAAQVALGMERRAAAMVSESLRARAGAAHAGAAHAGAAHAGAAHAGGGGSMRGIRCLRVLGLGGRAAASAPTAAVE